jgi:hypothetical protein
MFDEPIRVGLIRFADAYDDADQEAPDWGGRAAAKQVAAGRPASSEQTDRQTRAGFSLSHQPLLVVYTARD